MNDRRTLLLLVISVSCGEIDKNKEAPSMPRSENTVTVPASKMIETPKPESNQPDTDKLILHREYRGENSSFSCEIATAEGCNNPGWIMFEEEHVDYSLPGSDIVWREDYVREGSLVVFVPSNRELRILSEESVELLQRCDHEPLDSSGLNCSIAFNLQPFSCTEEGNFRYKINDGIPGVCVRYAVGQNTETCQSLTSQQELVDMQECIDAGVPRHVLDPASPDLGLYYLDFGHVWWRFAPIEQGWAIWLGGETENPLYDGSATMYCELPPETALPIFFSDPSGGPAHATYPTCRADDIPPEP